MDLVVSQRKPLGSGRVELAFLGIELTTIECVYLR
jgi:hypothetical protein